EATPPPRDDELVAVLRQVADALDAVHGHGLVHLDIKPENVLLAEPPAPGDPPQVYVADFGIARHDGADYTTPGRLMGTIAYAAPELLEGAQPSGPADVYSLGCVIYECLVGQVPFQHEHPAAVLVSHMRDRVPSVTERRGDLPGMVDDVIRRCMAKG